MTRDRIPRRAKPTDNFIQAGEAFFSSLFCYTLFQSRKFCGTFFILGLDFYLQDYCLNYMDSYELDGTTFCSELMEDTFGVSFDKEQCYEYGVE